VCGPCAEATDSAGSSPINWGACESECTGLAESACHGTKGCYAAYIEDPAADVLPSYTGCWQTSQWGVSTESCGELGPYQCAERDDCSLYYVEKTQEATFTEFNRCEAELYSAACAETDCGPGHHCEEQCDGTDNWMSKCRTVCVEDATCAAVDCGPGYTCAEVCKDGRNGPGTCGPTCVPDPIHDPGSCTGQLLCLADAPDCPSGTTAGVRNGCWTGYCIPNAACGPNNPGQCYLPVTDDQIAPACPSGTTPGVATNGRYTGYCIPTSECGPTACATLTTEAACTARADCSTVYTGTNCVCTADGCSCQTVTFDHCETL
jgi:hypothetical protein